jgi:probable HAF family extracellular repeat protein
MKRLCLLSVILLTLLSAAVAQFKYTTVECPNVKVAYIAAINNSGTMVGAYFTDTDPSWHALMIKHGECIPLAPETVLGTKGSMGWGLNERGDVVGSDFDSVLGFLLDKKGVLTAVNFPTADSTIAEGINQSGTVVGTWQIMDSSGNAILTHGFAWKDGAFSDFMVPDSAVTMVSGINARGDYVGVWNPDWNGLVGHGFVYSNGQIVTFDVPYSGAVWTSAEGINDKGHVAGAYSSDDGMNRGFLKVGPKFTPIDYPGALLTNLNGINNADQMVGWYVDADWALHALLVEKEK